MKRFSYALLGLCGLLSSMVLTACGDDPEVTTTEQVGTLTLEFNHVVGAAPLQLNSTTPYQTVAGDPFTVSIFRYYISNIKLQKADGTEFVQPESYYLIDEAQPASKTISLASIPIGDYTGLRFTLGVDSARNVAGAQIGVLAPSDMFWSWNTGYIYTKLEGRSSQSPTGAIIFHIGGFQAPYNTLRTIAPALNGTTLQVRTARTPQVRLKVDVLKLFAGPNPIRFATLNNTMGGANSVLVADNQAAGMFVVDDVRAN